MTRYVHFPFPVFHALFSVGAQPDQPWMIFDEGVVTAKVLQKNYKKPTEIEVGIDWEELNPSYVASWEAVATFSSETKIQSLPAKKECFELGCDDLVYRAKMEGQMVTATTDRIAGVALDVPVDVIVRPKPDQSSLVYLQVMPAGFAKRLSTEKA